MSEAATTNPVEAGAPAPADLRAKLAARWGTLAPRERSALLVAGAALALLAAWLLLVQPAWHTLRDAPAELDRLDAQVQEMRRLAAEARELRATAPVAPGQSAQALQAATQRLGGRGRLNLLGDRATLTLDGVAPDALADWLAEARRAARAPARGPDGARGAGLQRQHRARDRRRAVIRRRRPRGLWSPTIGSTGWAESTFAEEAWNRSRRAVKRWAIAGGLLGGLGALVAFAPASWLASAVTNATGSRVQLADARGTAWSGSAVLVLTGGAGSRDAAALPGRIEWTLGLAGTAIEVKLRHACCLNGTQSVRLRPRFGGFALTLPPAPQGVGQWPTAWLTGLGTPWNALNLGGTLRIATPGLTVESVQGRWRVEGRAEAELLDVTSRLVPLPVVGSYRVSLAQDGGGGAAISLATKEGALQLSGTGNIGAGGLRFRGEARAEPGQETALNNLLNIIGRRDGARSVLSIG